MGQKVNPIGFRTAVNKTWASRWFAEKKAYAKLLVEDERIRRLIDIQLRYAYVSKVEIERAGNRIRITIHSGRPGIVIGRKGQELEKLKDKIQNLTGSEVLLDIQEVKKPDLVAQLIAETLAMKLERRVSFRRAMKQAVQAAMSLGARGIRIQCSGRLGGAEIARTESQRSGSVPLHTLKENIDYGVKEAKTLYGIIGVKVWLLLESDEKK